MSLNQIKRKLKSINSTEKITNAMCLIATTKLKKQRNLFESVKDYFYDFYKIINILLDKIEGNEEVLSSIIPKGAKDSTLWININSSMGLCGSYNASLDNLVLKVIKPEDQIIQIGKQGLDFIKWQNLPNKIIDYYNFGDAKVSYNICLNLAHKILNLLNNGEFNKLSINYVKFINALKFEPISINILPIDPNVFKTLNIQHENHEYEFISDKVELLKSLLPDYIATVLYGALIEAKVSEYAARRNAMDMATKNAKELGEKYTLEYNNQRQAQITKEIIEIISGSLVTNKKGEKKVHD